MSRSNSTKSYSTYSRKVTTSERHSNSPTSSILKTPTPIFGTPRATSTKRLKFANGPVELQNLKNGLLESNECMDSGVEILDENLSNGNGDISVENNIIEVALSPVNKMQVSPDSWKAFLEYKKYGDYSNETEKTDYTYSRLSKYHKEIIPGFLARPNLCRSSIYSRRSSFSSPTDNSSIISESYISYEGKIPKKIEVNTELRTPSNISKSSRSKYYLRSMTYEDANIGEISNKPYFVEKEYLSNSAPGKIFKKTFYSSMEGSRSGYLSDDSGAFVSERSLGFQPGVQSESFESGFHSKASGGGHSEGFQSGGTQSEGFGDFKSNVAVGHFLSKGFGSSQSDSPGGFQSSEVSGGYQQGVTSKANNKYLSKVRSLDLDDADIDEVDDDPVNIKKHLYKNTSSQSRLKSASDSMSNFFNSVLVYLTSVGALSKDLFSKHILRRKDDSSNLQDAYSRHGNLAFASTGGPNVAWTNERSSGYYYPGGGYALAPRNWYQRLSNYFYDRYSQVSNLFSSKSSAYVTSRYHETSKNRKFWWLLLPLLLLAGSFLGYVDFYSNPQAILQTMYNGLMFVPSFLYYTVMVFIPYLLFEILPHFVLVTLPNFFLVTLPHFFLVIVPHFFLVTLPYFFLTVVPYFFLVTVPSFFWAVVSYVSSISLGNVWNALIKAPLSLFNFTTHYVKAAAGHIASAAIAFFSTAYLLSSNYLLLFYSHFCIRLFDLFTYLYQWVLYSLNFFSNAFNKVLSIF